MTIPPKWDAWAMGKAQEHLANLVASANSGVEPGRATNMLHVLLIEAMKFAVQRAPLTHAKCDELGNLARYPSHATMMNHRWLVRLTELAHGVYPEGSVIYETQPGESVAGIALRELGAENRWHEIEAMNRPFFGVMGPSDYYPVYSIIFLPKK